MPLVVKNPHDNVEDLRDVWAGFLGQDSRRRAWQPTPVFLTGKSHGERRLAGYSAWNLKELDMTRTHTPASLLQHSRRRILNASKVHGEGEVGSHNSFIQTHKSSFITFYYQQQTAVLTSLPDSC